MTAGGVTADRLVLVGGHESDGGVDLWPLTGALPGSVLTVPGRSLHHGVGELLDSGDGPVAVVPMTWGRDPVMVADTARTLRWLNAGAGAGRIALAEELGTPDHLVALMRMAATEAVARRPGTAVLLAAHAAGPFDDAELHRLAHLVRTHGTGAEVGVACLSGPDDLARAVDRLRRLGAGPVVVVPAGFARAVPGVEDLEGTTFAGPLLPEPVLVDLVRRRAGQALHLLGHGDDGIEAGLMADHGHGYAHSHGVEGDGGHHHGHDHAHPHPHRHAAVGAPPG